jgi:hypothetical protein
LEDVRIKIVQKDKKWAFLYPTDEEAEEEENVEPVAKKAKVEWISGIFSMNKLAKVACKIVGCNPEDVERNMYNNLFRQTLVFILGVELINVPRADRGLSYGILFLPIANKFIDLLSDKIMEEIHLLENEDFLEFNSLKSFD